MKTNFNGAWYFDGGCSRHMMGAKSNLFYIEIMEDHFVTFGNGSQAQVVGKGTLNLEGFTKFESVILVEDLKANLISIGQLCNQGLFVRFNHYTCTVYDKIDKCVLTETRSSNNCYLLEMESKTMASKTLTH